MEFTHYGWFCGCVPVRIAEPYSGCPHLETRYVPEWYMDMVEMIYGACIYVMTFIDIEYEPEYPILITGEY